MMFDLEAYRIEGLEGVLTPALAIYPEYIDNNIRVTLDLLGGDASRWRPHVKTAKLGYVIRRTVEHGVKQVKCATTLELLTSLEAGVEDALLAYPVVGANARRLRDIAAANPNKKISVLVENADQAASWQGTRIGVFIDVNPGMDRTGLEQNRVDEVVALAKALDDFRGLHYYDGHMHIANYEEREKAAHRGYDQLMKLTEAIIAAGKTIPEVITSGTPAMACGASYAPFKTAPFKHRVSPGTVTYCDTTSIKELPAGYKPAAIVVASVVSHPIAKRFTCDAGHKSVSADAGVPTCAVIGHEDWTPLKPSEEHLPVDVATDVPEIASHVYLIPRHVCPTVNNFDYALIVENHKITGIERVTARGREIPMQLALA
jgi:D-serine deaminase-like pyridoxal phosphate-dependent protein